MKLSYTENSKIETLDDIRAFVKHMIYDLHVNYNPDDDAMCYVNTETGEPTFTSHEAAVINIVGEKCFECAYRLTDSQDTMYDICSEILMDALGIQQ